MTGNFVCRGGGGGAWKKMAESGKEGMKFKEARGAAQNTRPLPA